MRVIERPSPNFGPRAADAAIDILLLHYTGMQTADAAIQRLRDPAAAVSAHYVIDEEGVVYRLVDEDDRAWHAGVSFWAGERDINSRSIGIELANPGHEFGYRPFPEPQMAALGTLATAILRRRRIPACRVLGHSDVAPARKQDPGELFDWARLARDGIGLWVEPGQEDEQMADCAELQQMLCRFGYGVEVSGQLDPATRSVLLAFQRHFRPDFLSGEPDIHTIRTLRALLRRSGL